jgi:2-keto-4-pentenoate hydratase/2-oxohepta-3-ene-1,7-dioic acid hydratase in catechol pathway
VDDAPMQRALGFLRGFLTAIARQSKRSSYIFKSTPHDFLRLRARPPGRRAGARQPQQYAVSRIFCVGRNYAAHAREMGFDPDREPPFYFNKTPADLVLSGATVPYPLGSQNYHYEMELVIAIGKPTAFRVSAEPRRRTACGATPAGWT